MDIFLSILYIFINALKDICKLLLRNIFDFQKKIRFAEKTIKKISGRYI